MLYYGLEWESCDSYMQFKEISTPGTPPASEIRQYAKDSGGVSTMCWKNDAGTELCLPTTQIGNVDGSGAAGQVAFWTDANTLSGENNLFWDAAQNRLGIGTASPGSILDIQGGSAPTALRLISGSAAAGNFANIAVGRTVSSEANFAVVSSAGEFSDISAAGDLAIRATAGDIILAARSASGDIHFSTGAADTRKAILTNAGRLHVGSNYNGSFHTGSDGIAAIESDGANAILEINDHNAAGTPYIFFHRSRGTHASPTIVSDGDDVAGILAKAYGGSSYHDMARILMEVDGTPGNNDMPGRIVFSVTPDGSATLAEAWRITQAGAIQGKSGGNTIIGGSGSGDDLTLQGSSHADGGSLILNSDSIVTASAAITGVSVLPTFTGAGDQPQGLLVQATANPSANINQALGLLGIVVANPPSGVTIGELIGFSGRTDYTATVGAVTTAYTFLGQSPAFGGSAIKPTTQYGLYIANQGSTGMTTAVGINIDLPTNATNNFYMRFGTADNTDPTGGGGAAVGRIPVSIAGTLRYIPYY